MKLAILNITAGGMSGGYKKYLCNLLPRLSSSPAVDEIVCTLPSFLILNDIPRRSNIKYVQVSQYSIINHKLNGELKLILDKFTPDVVYVPIERLFYYKKAPVVTMLQNIEPFVYPLFNNPLTEKVKNWLRFYNARKALQKADRIIAISQFVKDILVNQLHVKHQKIGIVYHGIDNINYHPKKPSYLPLNFENFIFTAGSIRPARGLEDILEALYYLSVQGIRIPLVIAGHAEPNMISYQKKLKDWIERNDLSSNIWWVGTLSAGEMSWCYQNCKAFIMASRVESFGMIGGEAMANGSICISADNPCLPELFGDAAIYYRPKDSKVLAETIKTVLSQDEHKRRGMSEKARKRAAEFSWDVRAEKTVEELAKAVEDFDKRKQG